MKLISVLLAATLTADAANDPGGAALDFLEKVRQRTINLEPGGDTAISPQVAREKKALIARRLDRLARDLGTDPLEVGAVKMDDGYAGVLVRKMGGFDPTRLQVFALALVKSDAGWTVAPVPASFENSGASYATILRQRLKALEDWMLREQVTDLQNLRENSQDQLQKEIEASLKRTTLQTMSSRQVGERFIEACQRGELPMVLGLMGGLSSKLPDDWPTRLKAAERALTAGQPALPSWRLLTAPEVARVVLQHDEEPDRALMSIGCLDPASGENESANPRIELVHLELSKSDDGLWQLNPPPSFLHEEEVSLDESDDVLDADLLNAFPGKWRESHPTQPQPTPDLAKEALLQALNLNHFQSLLALANLSGPSEAARKSCLEVARTWWKLHEPTAVRHAMPLALQADEQSAILLFQIVSAKDPARYNPQLFHFEKSSDGWLWIPKPSPQAIEKSKPWVDAESARWAEKWQSTLMANCAIVRDVDAHEAPTEAEVRSLIDRWIALTKRGDFDAALRLVGCLSDIKSPSILLQNLGYEIQSARRRKASPEITRVYQGKSWTAVGVKIDDDGKTTYPLYPIVRTDQGLRILIETDLFASGNRSRAYLNRTALERLQKATSAAASTELRELVDLHQKDVEEALKK